MLDLLDDIRDQPAALQRHAALINAIYSDVPGWIPADRQLVMTGMATSLYAWHSASLLLKDLPVPPAVVETSEYLRHGRQEDDRRPVLVISRSGESAEIVRLCEETSRCRTIVAVTEGTNSTLARRANRLLSFTAGETAFYNTKSFTLSQALALAIAGGLSQNPDLAPENWLDRLNALMARTVARSPSDFAPMAKEIAESRIALIVARGHEIGVAAQAALDLQEGMRIGAIPITGGLLRHGPLELSCCPDAAVLILIPNDTNVSVATQAVEDLRRYGARVVAIAAEGVQIPPDICAVQIPTAPSWLNPILFSAALQMLNVAIARHLGMSSIKPELIGKVTLVE